MAAVGAEAASVVGVVKMLSRVLSASGSPDFPQAVSPEKVRSRQRVKTQIRFVMLFTGSFLR